MEILAAVALSAAGTVTTISFFAMRYFSARPANGELKTLQLLDRKLIDIQERLVCHLGKGTHYV